jgi:DNA-binding NarL/FixJ family response regulator
MQWGMTPDSWQGVVPPPAPAPRVLLVAADPLARTGLQSLLRGRAELDVVGQAASAEEAPGALAGAPADVLLWDVGAAGDAGALPEVGPVPVVALVPEREAALEALRRGARGALERDVDEAALAAALVAAARGLWVAAPELLEGLLPPPRETPAPSAPRGEAFTPREREVLQLLAEGLSNKSIAARLSISEHTAKFHVNAVLSKLGVQRRAEAVGRAARLGLVIL